MRYSGGLLAGVLITLAAVTVTCDQPLTKIPLGPSALPVDDIAIVGPSSTAPGQSVQLSATVRMADGTMKTGFSHPDLRWRSSQPTVLQVSQTGLVTPLASQGETAIIVEMRAGSFTRSASREVVVLPPGTFRLSGVVSEEGLTSIKIPGARVEVTTGVPLTTTDESGLFKLYGVPPVADIRISADGYETRVFSVQLSFNAFRSFTLPLIGERPSLTGH